MKKLYNIIVLFAVLLMGVMVSCSPDQNDWNTDSSAKRPYAPSSVTAEIDSFSLALNITVAKLATAQSYEVQFSKEPLYSGFDETEGITTITTETGEIEIPRNDPRIGEQGISESDVFYVRARAINADGSKSKWVTNGMLYNEGYIQDADLAALLKKNAALKVAAPSGMWVTGVEENSMKLNWYMLPTSSKQAEKAYCQAPSYIINETLKEQGADEATYKHSITAEELEAYQYEWTGLTVGQSYRFTLYDQGEMKIGDVTESTEYRPNMDLAMYVTVNEIAADSDSPVYETDADGNPILDEKGNKIVKVNPNTGEPVPNARGNVMSDEMTGKQMFTTKGFIYNIESPQEFNGKKFKVTINNETASGWTEARNDWAANPVNEAVNYTVRGQIKKNSTAKLYFPSNGRLYILAYGKSENMLTQTDQEPYIFNVLADAQKTVIPVYQSETGETCKKWYMSYKVRVVEGEAILQIDNANSMYWFGFVFVPDDPNAGK